MEVNLKVLWFPGSFFLSLKTGKTICWLSFEWDPSRFPKQYFQLQNLLSVAWVHLGRQGRCPETAKCGSTSQSSSQNSRYSSTCFTFFLLSGHISQSFFLLPSDTSGNLRHILQPETWIAASLGSCVWVAALGASTTEGAEDMTFCCVVTFIEASCGEIMAGSKTQGSG